MTIGAAKRFLASAQTTEGFAVIEALIRAEEELQAIRANPGALFADALKPLGRAILNQGRAIEGVDFQFLIIESTGAERLFHSV